MAIRSVHDGATSVRYVVQLYCFKCRREVFDDSIYERNKMYAIGCMVCKSYHKIPMIYDVGDPRFYYANLEQPLDVRVQRVEL